jgi:uncharacterized protein (TIRG00374 family)
MISPKDFVAPTLLLIIIVVSGIVVTDFETLRMSFTILSVEDMLLVAILVLAGYLIRFAKWEYLLREQTITVSLRKSLYVFFSGLAMVITPAKSGEIWKSWLLESTSDVKKSKTAPVIIVERMTDLIALLILGLAVVLEYSLIATATVFIVIIVLAIFHEDVLSILERLVRNKFSDLSYVENGSETFFNSMEDLLSLKTIVLTSIVSVFAWMFEAISLWYIVLQTSSSVSIFEATSIFGGSSVAGAITFLPGGLGITEAGLVSLLMSAGLSVNISTQITVVLRVMTLWFAAFIGAITYAIGKLTNTLP